MIGGMPDRALASCLCGRVRIEVDLPAQKAGHCHCDNCRRAHGAGVWTFATFQANAVRVVDGGDELTRHLSDVGSTRSFCRVCGTTLLYESPRWPGVVDLSLANFHDSVGAVPGYHAYADRAPGWCPILDDLPQQGGPSGVEPL